MSQLMRRSVTHVLEVLARPSHLPRFQLRVELLPSGRLALEPSETELTAALHSLIHSVSLDTFDIILVNCHVT